jgi:hypothetical protein
VTWLAILATSLGCYLLKVAGLFVPKAWLEVPFVARVAALLPVALLAALIALQAATDGRAIELDARLAGLAVAIGAQWRKAPFLVVVGAACATTALVRVVT